MKCETSLSEGLKKVRAENRPGMVIFHKETCGACRKLKPKFLASKAIQKLSQSFVVISLDKSEPDDPNWYPDGKYYPRVLFTDNKGRLMKNIVNVRRKTKYLYFYSNEDSLVRSMEKVLCVCTPDTTSKQTAPEMKEHD